MRPGIYGIWTASKALLIDEYLRSFVWITRHGTYIDGFAGPKEPHAPETWAAKRVVDRHPSDPTKRRIRHFYLVDNDEEKYQHLKALHDGNPTKDVRVWHDDFNRVVDDILPLVGKKEAAFCLLDQHTMECDWETVWKIAHWPKAEFKIEQFYFLPTWWVDRAIAGAKVTTLRRWWGNDGWKAFRGANTWVRGQMVAERFRSELGYAYATPWPVRDTYNKRGRIMYFMIHASDHHAAPKLMARANTKAMGTALRQARIEPLF